MKRITTLIKLRQSELIEEGAEKLLRDLEERRAELKPSHPAADVKRESYSALLTLLYRALLYDLKSSNRMNASPSHFEAFIKAFDRIPTLRNNTGESLHILSRIREDVNRVVCEATDLFPDLRIERLSLLNNLIDSWMRRLVDHWLQQSRESAGKNAQLVDDLRVVKNELQRQLNVLYQIINTSPLGVVDCDQDLRIIHWNTMASRLTGYAPAEILKKNVADIMYGRSRDLFTKRVNSKNELISNLNINIRKKDGGFFPSIMSISKTRPPHPGNIYLIIRFTDMSVHEKEASLNQRIQQLTTISRLTSAMMHDIRNPLNNIGLNSEILGQTLSREYGDLKPETHKILDAIQRQIYMLNESLNHYLSYTHLSELNVEPTDLGAQLQTFIQDTGYQAAMKKIKIHFRRPRSRYRILADWHQLRRVFSNIVQNSLEALGESGDIYAKMEKHRHRILVRIRDNGPGIDPGRMNSIFQPFFTTKESNNGLGLFIAKEIVTAHRGRLSFTSIPGRGTEFTISLPLIQGDTEGLA